jgi:hypothetical protein
MERKRPRLELGTGRGGQIDTRHDDFLFRRAESGIGAGLPL